ncbi:MAG: hypothetical protein ACRDZ8_13230 [Acidimicrobiales bacterium]
MRAAAGELRRVSAAARPAPVLPVLRAADDREGDAGSGRGDVFGPRTDRGAMTARPIDQGVARADPSPGQATAWGARRGGQATAGGARRGGGGGAGVFFPRVLW